MGTWSAAAIGAVMFTIAAICIRKGKMLRGTSWLMLLAGACLSGMLGGIIGWLTGLLSRVFGTATEVLFGAAVPGLIAIAIGAVLAIDMHPKKGRTGRLTPWLALSFVPLLVATFGGVMEQLPDAVNSGVTEAGNAISQAIGDLLQNL
jgi:hypothetical protein